MELTYLVQQLVMSKLLISTDDTADSVTLAADISGVTTIIGDATDADIVTFKGKDDTDDTIDINGITCH